MTSRTAATQSRQQIADALEYQLGDDDLPGVWRLNAQDVRTVIEALRSESAPTPELTYEDGREDGLNAAARVCDKRAEKIDDANRCETASVLAYQIRALKKAAPVSTAPNSSVVPCHCFTERDKELCLDKNRCVKTCAWRDPSAL